MISSVCGSMIRACGGVASEGQTLTIRPRLSKVSEPQSAAAIASEPATSASPTGPRRR